MKKPKKDSLKALVRDLAARADMPYFTAWKAFRYYRARARRLLKGEK